jgi:hypothetical protein
MSLPIQWPITLYVKLEAHILLPLQTLHVHPTTSLQWSESNTHSTSLSMRSIFIGAYFSSICGGKGGLKLERQWLVREFVGEGHFREELECALGCWVLTLALPKDDPEYKGSWRLGFLWELCILWHLTASGGPSTDRLLLPLKQPS